jgi:hypothetical protein
MSCRIREEMLTLDDIIGKFGFTVYAPPADGRVKIERGYASDLLSDVIANAEKNDIWVTMQVHVNIIAVAALKDVAAIVIVSHHKPADETIAIAKQKGVCVLGTGMTAFETCGRLYAVGIREEGKQTS